MSDFMQFAHSHGLIINRLLHGKIVRCATQSHKSKRNGAFFFDGLWGWVMDWQCHDKPIVWKSDQSINDYDIQKRIKKSQHEYQQERARLNAEAAKKSQWILSQCELDLSSYLARKGFPEMCGNIWKRNDEYPLLVIPMHKDNRIVGCQLIDHEGSKKFLKGQETKGSCFQIGNGNKTFFVEGYASGLSLQSILNSMRISYKIIIAFSAGNISHLSRNVSGFIVADNDESRTGQKIAMESGLSWWMPPVVGMDINDYHQANGIFKVSQELKRLIYKKL